MGLLSGRKVNWGGKAGTFYLVVSRRKLLSRDEAVGESVGDGVADEDSHTTGDSWVDKKGSGVLMRLVARNISRRGGSLLAGNRPSVMPLAWA